MKDFFEHIDDYLQDRLDLKDRKVFEEAMAKDPDLQRAVENHDIVEEVLDLMIEEDIRNTIKSIDDEDSRPIDQAYGLKTFLIILGIMLLLALIGFLFNQLQKESPEEIYATFYSPYVASQLRGTDAIPNDITTCDRGHALMELQEFDEARLVLVESAQKEDDCTDQSQWYLTLIYLREGNETERDSLLDIIVLDNQSPYQDRAIQLRSKL